MAAPDHGIMSHSDTIDAITIARAASHSTMLDLRAMRVCTTMRDAVDQRLQDPVWKASWLARASEFCHDLVPGTVLAPGAVANLGLVRMIDNDLYAELSIGMREFLFDNQTQLAILQTMHIYLNLPQDLVRAELHAQAATDSSMHRMVAQSMRFHANDPLIQGLGVAVMGRFKDFDCSVAVAKYVIAVLIPVMQNDPTAQAQRRCLKIICCIAQRSTTPWIMLNPTTNILSIVVESMQKFPEHAMIAFMGTMLMDTFTAFIDIIQDSRAMQAFDVAAAEEVLCQTMHTHYSFSNLQQTSMMALKSLYEKYPDRMRQHRRVLTLTMHALPAFLNERHIAKSGMLLILALVPSFRNPVVDDASLLVGFEVFPVILATVCAVLNIPVRTPNDYVKNKQMCTTAFRILHETCRETPANAETARSMHIVEHLVVNFNRPTGHFQIDGDWQFHCDELQHSLGIGP